MLGISTFIIGCGRSGTTALGRALEQHQDVRYLNEPRHIWNLDPATNIWNDHHAGRLDLTGDDLNRAKRWQLRGAFAREVRFRHGVEKTPINSFRVAYLAALYPSARFVHLVRNGLEVASSIANRGDRWWGRNGSKWALLVDYSERVGLGDLPALCTNHRLRGLLEWRLSVETAQRMLTRVPHVEIYYRDLVDNPDDSLRTVCKFLGLQTFGQLKHGLHREKPPVYGQPSGIDHRIAGELLMGLAD